MPLADEIDMALAEKSQALASRLLVVFYMRPRRNPLKSAEAGREVHDDVEYVKIVVPGDRDGPDRPATQRDRETYARQYAAFLANKSQDAASGTPLSSVPWLAPSLVADLHHFNCRTLEQLAAMPDTSAQKFPGILALRQKARDFIELAKGAAPMAKLREELEESRRNERELRASLEALAAEVKALRNKK